VAITLMPLPYAPDALQPAISADTLNTHHGKHHKTYVDKTNQAIAGTALADHSLEQIIAATRTSDKKVFNQAAQTWNHGFYWASLSPESTKPSADLAAAISSAFSSHQDMVEQLITQGAEHFGSGWVWLVSKAGELAIEATHDAGQPEGEDANPLLVLDVWEHAYYLDRKQDRKAYLKAVSGKIDWQFASENFARQSRWTYPR